MSAWIAVREWLIAEENCEPCDFPDKEQVLSIVAHFACEPVDSCWIMGIYRRFLDNMSYPKRAVAGVIIHSVNGYFPKLRQNFKPTLGSGDGVRYQLTDLKGASDFYETSTLIATPPYKELCPGVENGRYTPLFFRTLASVYHAEAQLCLLGHVLQVAKIEKGITMIAPWNIVRGWDRLYTAMNTLRSKSGMFKPINEIQMMARAPTLAAALAGAWMAAVAKFLRENGDRRQFQQYPVAAIRCAVERCAYAFGAENGKPAEVWGMSVALWWVLRQEIMQHN